MGEPALDISHVALRRRRTKIVATLGPASTSDAVIEALIGAGVDVFRLNFSHGSHDEHGARIECIRRVAEKRGAHVAILADLSGPKIRVGRFEGGGIDLRPGERVVVTCRDGVTGRPGLIPSRYPELAKDVRAGDRVLLDDGRLELRVESTTGVDVEAIVVRGGRLTDRKGMNLPGVAVSAPSLTAKDRDDARFAVARGADFLALSFVRRAADVLALREHLGPDAGRVGLIAKIEKPEAIDDIGPILDAADGIMVARGDLGVEMPPEVVPIVQQELVRRAVEVHKPVIVATQMLESMVDNARPTRAEVSDVAGAAQTQADAVMLSAETATGRYPVEAVATMDRVLRLVEGYQWKRGRHGHVVDEPEDHGRLGHAQALSRATSLLSGDLGVRAVVVSSRSGNTARLVSAARPAAPVVALCADEALCRRLNLLWGVVPERLAPAALAAPREAALTVVRHLDLAEPGAPVLLVWDASPEPSAPQPSLSILLLDGQ